MAWATSSTFPTRRFSSSLSVTCPRRLPSPSGALLNLACLFGVAVILRRHFRNFSWLTPFAFGPTISLLLNGQDLGILALLMALAFDRFAKEKDLQAGAILALGLFKFPLIVPLVAILAFRYWRVLAGFVAVALPLLLASALVVGRQGIHDYVALTHGTDAKEAPGILINLRGVVGVLFGTHPAVVIALSIALIALAAFIRGKRIPVFCVALIVTQLASWHAHLYDALILLIPMAWMYESKSPWIRHAPTALILMTAAMLLDPSYGFLLAIFLCGLLPLLWRDPMRPNGSLEGFPTRTLKELAPSLDSPDVPSRSISSPTSLRETRCFCVRRS